MNRLVLLGASNVRRGLPAIARLALGGGTREIFGAFGHGRSYGRRSCIPFRCLPGIRECGIWREIASAPPAETAAVIADVGNDILYGESPETILGWVSECIDRLSTPTVTIVGLPVPRLRALGPARFLFFRSMFFPSSRRSRAHTVSAAEEIDAGLRRLTELAGARFVAPDPAWYGADPIHVRRECMLGAWSAVLGMAAGPTPPLSPAATLRLRMAAPERRTLFGIERRRAQPAWTGPGGIRVALY